MAKHTGGKWKRREEYGRHWIEAGKHQIADVSEIEKKVGGEMEADADETRANAVLLAAAPEMLGELEKVLVNLRDMKTDWLTLTDGQYGTFPGDSRIRAIVRLIAKAKGE